MIGHSASLRFHRVMAALSVAAALLHPAPAAAQSEHDLAAAAQNPVAAMYSLPFQNNTFFGVGPSGNDTANVLNIQPVIPMSLGRWNIISRTIAPLVYLPDLTGGLPEFAGTQIGRGSQFGLGDINQSFYFSPADARALIWGVGPTFTFPTATDRSLGSGQFSMGVAGVALVMPKPWVIGLLARQQWSVAGPDGREEVNQLLLQPFVNYNLPGGWYLVSSPVVTANWSADRTSDRWTIPVGGGAGKIFRIGSQAVNAQAQAFYYLDRPQFGPEWALRFQLQFLFPRSG